MKYKLYTGLAFGVIALGASAQCKLNIGDRVILRELMESSGAVSTRGAEMAGLEDGRVDLILRYTSEEALSQIEAAGGEVISRVGYSGAIVRVAPEMAEAMAATRGILTARLSVKAATKNDKARPMSGVESVWNGESLPASFRGKGVIAGIYDVGMDPNHITFRNPDNSLRSEVVWGYSGSSSKPTVYDTPELISKFTTDSRSDSHGTHVLGIMAGSFRDTISSGAADYRGVAPDARLAVAGGAGYLSQILDAMERVGQYAEQQQVPCVANLSFGDNVGPHDGSDTFTALLNEIADKYNMVLCLAAGNERGDNVAVVKTLTEETPSFATVLKRGYRSTNSSQANGELQVWSSDSRPLDVTFELVSSENPDSVLASYKVTDKEQYLVTSDATQSQFTGATLIRDTENFSTHYSRSGVGGIGYVDKANGRYVADCNVILSTLNFLNATSYSTYFRVVVKGAPGQKAYVYVDGIYMTVGGHNQAVDRYEVPDGYGSNSNMSGGKNTLCVGSYVSANRPGSGYPNGIVGDPSYFSSYGEAGDGREMPDVCAPGQVIMSARNTYCSSSSYPKSYSYRDPDSATTYSWTTMAGTSQASPHAAGVAALIRSVNPTLDYKEVKEIMRSTAVLPTEGKGWGRGMLDAYAAVKKTLTTTSVYDLVANGTEGTIIRPVGINNWEISVPAEDGFKINVYGMDGSMMVGHSVEGPEYTLEGNTLPKGLYILTVQTRQGVKSQKIMIQ